MSTTPPTPVSVSRRVLLLSTLATGLVACTPTPASPPPPDPLAALAARARADAALASAIASATPALAGVAEEVAKVRGEHAAVLQKEVDRERPPKPSSSAAPTTTAAPTVPSNPKAALAEGLKGASDEASEVAVAVPRHRAGMVGSVAAGCVSLLEVLA
ncbi:hypothetical protein V5P93_005545 [Actinokineospora auranticolor]|uniref:Uncharacterized protein n=1 Tax=Actinokineospora auranticolor TaxID=155976 RepID=A0A2S6GQG7_9PSEU|nr:hypothetical protein [Actinokineospora auranticolor]PPK67423.1 hypothetical protein CLV40_10786 [Actinokineospora auranticolor]